jgi:hypothetical protein
LEAQRSAEGYQDARPKDELRLILEAISKDIAAMNGAFPGGFLQGNVSVARLAA